MQRMIYLVVILLIGCEMIEYHPNQVIVDEEYQGLNHKNIKQIKANQQDDTVRFALFGDTQRFYEETNAFVQKINSMSTIDFAVLAGDITDFGLSTEYKWINEIISGLKVPYITVIGNHDLVANGQQVYEEMYGPLNYCFELKDQKFIALNTNSREYAFNGKVPDLNWLDKTLKNNEENKKVVIISHVPPFSTDFDKNLEQDYASLLSSDRNVLASMHAHNHEYRQGEYYDDGVYYFVTTTVGERSFALVTLVEDDYKIEKVYF